MKISFKPLSVTDFENLLKWFQQPHVKKWWDVNINYTLELIQEKYGSYVDGYKKIGSEHKPIQAFIIYFDDTPIGYIQYYNAYDFPRDGHQLNNLPKSLAAIDFFIGDENHLGKGIGAAALELFLDNHVFTKFDYAFVDPDSSNLAAIKTYERVGFKRLQKQENSTATWMILENRVVSVNNTEHFTWGKICNGWWLKRDNNFTVIEETIPPGGLETRHFHKLTEQFFYVLHGIIHIEINGYGYRLKNNQGVTIPAGSAHQVFNKSNNLVRFLVISCPGSHGDRVNVHEE